MKRLADYHPLPQGDEQFPLEFVERRRALKLSQNETTLIVGLADPDDEFLKAELQQFFDRVIEVVPIEPQELAEYLSRETSRVDASAPDIPGEKLLLDRLANDAPVVNLVNNVLLEGIRLGCSDIHVEAFSSSVRVRYRIDGVLRVGRTLPRSVFASLSSRLKVMANLNIIERRQPQDGRLTVNVGGRDVEFRVSIVPITDGESIVLRLFRRQEEVRDLASLGFTEPALGSLEHACSWSNGLVLITGPTGSGKTTTLNALIRSLATDDRKVLTIEDPVEIVVDGVNQIQTNESIGLTFDTLLRRLLRQDPDVLMVGEIRDRKTADLSVRSALTGHLVFSTLHTNDALSAIPRLTNMGAEPYLLGAVLRAVAAQRLVRTLCPLCSEPHEPRASQREWLTRRWNKPLPPAFVGRGCEACQQTGYRGRTVVSEVFPIDDSLEELVLQGAKRKDLEAYVKRRGDRFLFDDAVDKVARGLTTWDEVERAVMTR